VRGVILTGAAISIHRGRRHQRLAQISAVEAEKSARSARCPRSYRKSGQTVIARLTASPSRGCETAMACTIRSLLRTRSSVSPSETGSDSRRRRHTTFPRLVGKGRALKLILSEKSSGAGSLFASDSLTNRAGCGADPARGSDPETAFRQRPLAVKYSLEAVNKRFGNKPS